jgi:phage-related protein
LQWGKDLIDNFVQGIKNNIAKVGDAVKGVADKVKSFLGFSEPDEGPLKNFHTFGKDMMENYATSIENAQYLVRNAVDDVAADVAVLNQPFSYSDMYEAVRSGASDSNTNIYLNDREVTRALSGLGVSFNG